jgi:hypothetical protein
LILRSRTQFYSLSNPLDFLLKKKYYIYKKIKL